MIKRSDLYLRRVIESLRSTVCPACGGDKKSRQTLCRREYFKLPAPMRKALYAGVGEGYEEAMLEAFTFLSVDTFHDSQPIPSTSQEE